MALIINAAINGFSYGGGGSWTNSDGLYLRFGTLEAWQAGGGDYRDHLDGKLVTDNVIDLSALVTANPTAIALDPYPTNFIIEAFEIFVETVAASSGSGTLGIGLWDQTAAATISDTAIASGITTAIMTAGAVIRGIVNPAGNTALGNTYAGADLGAIDYSWTQPPSAANHQIILTAKAGTAVFQSGVVRLRTYGRRSLAGDTTYSPGGQS